MGGETHATFYTGAAWAATIRPMPKDSFTPKKPDHQQEDPLLVEADRLLRNPEARMDLEDRGAAAMQQMMGALLQVPMASPTGTCPTSCTQDCPAPCHEVHRRPWERAHVLGSCLGELGEQEG